MAGAGRARRGIALGAALCFAFGCEGPPPDPADGSTGPVAASPCGNAVELGPCCRRVTAQAEPSAIALRLTAMSVSRPTVFASLADVLQAAIQDLRVNVLFEITGELGGGSVEVRVGAGIPIAGPSSTRFAFYDNPENAAGTEWRAARAAGTLEPDGRLRTAPAEGVVRMPAVSGDYPERCNVFAVIPLRGMQILEAWIDEDRTCVGERYCRRLEPDCFGGQARMVAYVALSDAERVCSGAITNNLCESLAGAPCDQPREDWPRRPDALCVGSDCRTACDPLTECNAYEVRADIMAGAVEIVDADPAALEVCSMQEDPCEG